MPRASVPFLRGDQSFAHGVAQRLRFGAEGAALVDRVRQSRLVSAGQKLVNSCQKLQRGHRDVTSWQAATRIARPPPGLRRRRAPRAVPIPI